MLLMHDLPEARINDLHKVGQRYVDLSDAERKVISEQAGQLGEQGKKYKGIMEEFLAAESGEAVLARDADMLECAIQAKEYMEQGHKDVEDWITNIEKKLRTEEAKQILEEVKKSSLKDWWKKLKKV